MQVYVFKWSLLSELQEPTDQQQIYIDSWSENGKEEVTLQPSSWELEFNFLWNMAQRALKRGWRNSHFKTPRSLQFSVFKQGDLTSQPQNVAGPRVKWKCKTVVHIFVRIPKFFSIKQTPHSKAQITGPWNQLCSHLIIQMWITDPLLPWRSLRHDSKELNYSV